MKNKLILVIQFVLICSYMSYSQEISEKTLKIIYTYKFPQYITWPNEASFTHYSIGVLTDDEAFFKKFHDILVHENIKGKSLKVVMIKSLEQVSHLQLLYVDEKKSTRIKEVINTIGDLPILLITENYDDKRIVMINIYEESQSVKFEINKANILNHNLKVDSKLIFLGGTEIDVASLYKDSQKDLEREKEIVNTQKNTLKTLQTEIETTKNAISKQNEELKLQNEELKRQQNQLEILNQETSEKEAQLKKQEVALKNLVHQKDLEMHTFEKKIKRQALEIEEGEKNVEFKIEALKRLSIESELLSKEIHDNENILKQQSTHIKEQNNLLLIFMLLIACVLVLSFFIYRNYIIQKKFNIALASKNFEIEKGTILLKQEKENTINSIRYAKTIQKAILPGFEEFNKLFSSFILLRPRDIVSGDFIWFHIIDAGTDTSKCLIAAIDCTGHGVPGAFMSMIGNTLLNEIVKVKMEYDPGKILDYLDDNIRILLNQKESENTDGMDACFCLIERDSISKTARVLFSGAKRPLYYITENMLHAISGDKKVIGGGNTVNNNSVLFKTHELYLPIGSTLYLSTDGIFDQNDQYRVRLGRKRFESMLMSVVTVPIESQKALIENQLNEFMKNTEQRDDIALIGITI